MGNKPSHRSFEGDSAGVSDPDSGRTALGRLIGIVRGLVGGPYRRFVADLGHGGTSRSDGHSESGRREDEQVATPAVPPFPQRDRPFTRPARDRGTANPSDLRATEENGRLSIYYPDRDGAEITSDTWERIDR